MSNMTSKIRDIVKEVLRLKIDDTVHILTELVIQYFKPTDETGKVILKIVFDQDKSF